MNNAKCISKKKATIAIYNVLKNGRTYNLSIVCLVDHFEKLVKPILLYRCKVWGYENIDIMEWVQTNTTTPTDVVYGELGQYPLEIEGKLRMVSFWTKLSLGKESKLSAVILKYILAIYKQHLDLPG